MGAFCRTPDDCRVEREGLGDRVISVSAICIDLLQYIDLFILERYISLCFLEDLYIYSYQHFY